MSLGGIHQQNYHSNYVMNTPLGLGKRAQILGFYLWGKKARQCLWNTAYGKAIFIFGRFNQVYQDCLPL